MVLKYKSPHKKAFSLMEMIVCMALICLIMILAFGILPSSFMSLRKSSYYQFASAQAVRIMDLAVSSPLPSELRTADKYPPYNSLDEVFSASFPVTPLPSVSDGHKEPNPGKIVFDHEHSKVHFFYVVTYYAVDIARDSSSPGSLVDITVEMWWSERQPSLEMGNDFNLDSLQHIKYIQRVYRRGELK